ncbi:MAG: NAD(+) synthase [bacterium]
MKVDPLIDYIVHWLKDYCNNAGLNGFVVGVSGGIDSAVTSTLCAKTGTDTIVLNMPIYQASEQVSLSEQHIGWLEQNFHHVKGLKIDLTAAFQALEKIYPSDIQDGLTMANTRSRLRMLTLYAVASHPKMLVVGTGNKVEDFGVGFFTKYGDGGVDISPIADLMKSEVYAIGKALGIIEAILNAPPTDGLWVDNRTDESQIGANYAELEWAMGFDTEPKDEDRLSERQKQVLDIYRRFYHANRHKMNPIPVCKIPEKLKRRR